MTRFSLIVTLGLLAALLGCSSYQYQPDQIRVTVAEDIMADERKGYAVERYRADAYLEQYLRELIADYDIRNTLHVEAEIKTIYIGWGRDRMEVEATVREGSRVVERFTFGRTTGKGSPVKRLTVALAKDIVGAMRRL